jgi:molybdopterin molybdotransferase
MIPVQEARKIVKEVCAGIPRGREIETVPLDQSLGQVLAETLMLTRDYPPYDRAMRDGYAVRVQDLDSLPAVLTCSAEVQAGAVPDCALLPGQAIRIMTGAAVPEGAEAIVMVEDTLALGENQVQLNKRVAAEANIARKGAEKKSGTALLVAGTRIGPPEFALLALEGKVRCQVYRKPRVLILSTGDEIVGIDADPGPFQVRDVNSFSLYAQSLVAGCQARRQGIVPDQPRALRERILDALPHADLLILSGGVSRGSYDFVKPALQELGAVLHFDSISLRPGKPTVLATLGKKIIFGLPGNPVSTFVTFFLFVQPVLAVLHGRNWEDPPVLSAVLTEPIHEKQGRTAFLPARISQGGEGLTVSPVAWQGSADFFALCTANGFIIVPEQVREFRAGDLVEALLFGNLLSGLPPHF